MECNWSIAPLRSFVTELFKGIAPKYVFMDDKGAIPVLGQKCVRNFEIDMSQARFTDSFAKPVKQEKLLQKYDILINATGVGSAGRVAQLRDAVPNCTVDGHVIVLRATGIDPLYLGYALKQKQPIIEQLAEGSTGQTEMNRQRLQDEILISFPEDRDNQRKTASLLANLDAQIANLNRTNGYLTA